jgi:hypothetical protein
MGRAEDCVGYRFAVRPTCNCGTSGQADYRDSFQKHNGQMVIVSPPPSMARVRRRRGRRRLCRRGGRIALSSPV